MAAANGEIECSETVHFERDRGVTEVQVTRGLAHVTVEFAKDNLGNDRLALLRALADAEIPVFLVKLLPIGISFALRERVVEAGETLLKARGARYAILRDLGQVAVVAGAMRDLSGVMALIYEALVGANVLVRQTGDAYNAVICLVPGESTDRAATALRDCFFKTPEPATGQSPLVRKGL